MKTLHLIIVALCLIIAATACRTGKRHTVIEENGNGTSLKIEYLGQTNFNAEGTAIKSISPNGYVKYTRNDKQLTAESDDHSRITYEMNDAGKQTILDEAGREFLAQAVKDMIKHGHYADVR